MRIYRRRIDRARKGARIERNSAGSFHPAGVLTRRSNNYSVPVEYAGRTVGVKGFAEKVEVYAEGKRIASHARCFGKHQSVYRLEHYLPLLEQRGRAILNAAPVRQNLPEEILEQIRTCDPKERIRILRQYCGNPELKAPAVTDVVRVRPVDLRRYDALTDGKAVIAHVRCSCTGADPALCETVEAAHFCQVSGYSAESPSGCPF